MRSTANWQFVTSYRYAIAKHGELAVCDFLSDYVCHTAARVAKPLTMYSPALHWWDVNKHNGDYTTLIRMFQEHAENNIPMEPGEVFMWPVKRRKVYTFALASHEYELSEDRILRTLETKMAPTPVPRFLKRAEIHHWLLDAKSYVTTSEAAAALGCTIELVDLLIKGDLLAAVPNKTYDGRIYRLVHMLEITRFRKVLQDRVSKTEITNRFRKIGSYSFRSICSRGEIIELAVAGHVQKIAHPEAGFRIDQLLFDLDEVREQLIKIKKSDVSADQEFDHEMVKMDGARRRLGVGRATIEGLVENGLIEATLRVNDVHHKGRINKWIRTADLDEFADSHWTIAQVAARSSVDQREILDRLAVQNVEPVFEEFRQREKFYRRSDIEGLNLI